MENVQSWEGRDRVMGIAEGGDSEWESEDENNNDKAKDKKELECFRG